jgi:hypothetical protein
MEPIRWLQIDYLHPFKLLKKRQSSSQLESRVLEPQMLPFLNKSKISPLISPESIRRIHPFLLSPISPRFSMTSSPSLAWILLELLVEQHAEDSVLVEDNVSVPLLATTEIHAPEMFAIQIPMELDAPIQIYHLLVTIPIFVLMILVIP